MPQATFSSRKVKFRTLLFISKFDTNTVSYFMVLARSEEWQRILSWLHFQTLKQRNATGVTNRAICRVNGSVSPVGSIKHYGFVARNTGARQKWRVCAEKHAVFCIAVGNACWFARPVRANPRPKARLGSPDRAPQKLSMCIEKPRRARAY
jgi:hypothetical protein